MASDFLTKKAKEQAEKLEKEYGSSAYGGTTWLNEQLTGKKKKKKDADDIASVLTANTVMGTPVKKEKEKEDDRKWFEKGAFEDGYQFGDVVKTLLGTDKDILDNMGQGARKMAENVVDAGLTGVGFVAEKVGADAFAGKVKEAVSKDFSTDSSKLLAPIAKTLLNTPVMQPVNTAIKGITGLNKVLNGEDDASVLGEKSDSLVQSATQFAIQSGLTTVGVPWYLTAGVTSFGGEAENAFQQGATYNQAALSGVISAGSEILTEKLFGGSGLGEKGLINLEPLTKGITNKVVKTIADYGIDLMSEGSEEVVSQVISNLGSALYKEENLSDILLSEEALDGYIESFVGGVFISGGANAGKVSNSIKTGRDYRSGLSANEQAVVSKEVENRIAEQEQDGKKLTKDEKAAIEEAVIREMEKGYISTETIEEVLGGEDFKNYQAFAGEENRLVEQEKALKEEFDALNKMRQFDMTGEQIDRRLELKSQLEDIRKQIAGINEGGMRDTLQQTLSNRVMELTKNDRLAESYNERSRRGQAYQADISKYDAKQQATIQKAIDSGILNDTRRTHEFVDMIAKISADKGVLFDFTNNEKLASSGFAVNGKAVNGYVTKDGVTLNIESAKSMNSVVGHEITHVLEGTDMYTALQSVVMEYAKTKGEYDSRLASLTELYKNVEGADVSAELTADLVGDYLFTDADFVKHLSVTNRNVFQKIYDEIKYLYKVATAGSKEARELEKIKHTFENVYRETGKAQAETKYSLSYTTDNKPVAVIETDIFNGKFAELTESERIKIVKNAIKDFRPGVPVSGRMINISRKSAEHFTNSDYTDKIRNNDPELYEDKLNIAQNMDDVVYASTDYINEDLKHPRKDNITQFARGTVLLDVGGSQYKASVLVGYTSMQEMVLYDVQDLTATTFETKKKKAPPKLAGNNSDTRKTDVPSRESLTENGENVKYSLSDSDGRELSPAVQKRFGNSKVVDENGSLKVVYHGTATGEFSIFDKAKGSVEGDFGSGFYFTDNETDVSEHYEGGGPDFENKVGRRADQIWGEEPDIEYEEAESRAREELYKGSHKFEVYLNIENPAIVGETMLLDGESYMEQYSEDDFDDYDEYIEEVEQLVANDIENIVWEVERNVDVYSTDGIAEVLWEAYGNGGMEIEELKKRLNDLYLEDSEGNLVANEVARQIIESLGYDGIIDPTVSGKWNMDIEEGTTHYIVFKPNQIKAITNENPTDNPDIHRSLSPAGKKPKTYGNYNVYGKDIALETAPVEEVAPVQEQTVAENATVDENLFPDDFAPIADDPERFNSLDDADAPPVRNMEYGERGNQMTMPKSTVNMIADNVRDALWVEDRQIGDVRRLVEEYGKQEFPDRNWLFRELKDNFGKHTEKVVDETTQEVKTVIRKYRLNVSDTIKGDIADYNDLRRRNFGKVLFSRQGMDVDSAYEELSAMYPGYFPNEITNPTDQLLQIIEVANMNGATEQTYELDDETVWDVVDDIAEAVSDYQYIQMEKDAGKAMPKEAFDDLVQNADAYAPPAEDDIAPVSKPAKSVPMAVPVAERYETIAPKKQTQPRMAKATEAEQKAAKVLAEEPKVERKKPTAWNLFKDNFIDKGTVFETLSLKTGNRELQAKWKSVGRAESSAQWFMEHGNAEASSLKSIRETVEKSGKTQQFSEYLYHMHNVDRMNLEDRYDDVKNKPVFGYGVTSDMSKAEAAKLEKANPEFKQWAESVYSYMTTMREMMVDNGVISRETAKLWAEMYPHYVPIRRKGDEGLNINVALDTKRTGVNAPVKKATGGNRNILPLFDTMALRTEQTFKAIARNRFGVELKNLLGTTLEQDAVSVDDAIDSVEGEQLQAGKDGRNPTFTVFENGEKVTFEITDEMYNTMKPKSDAMMYTNKVLNTANNIRRGLLTEYNPAFMLTNPIKDTQDVLINSQHPARTYANYPKAMAELLGKKGQYYQEYMEHGGEMNTYFDGETKTFAKEKSGLSKVIGFPLEKISQANNFIERVPRMAEYIASRKMGRSIDVSMLDAARVTTDFSAGGDLVRMANRNGFTFLNASVQGAVQQVRNVREAKAEGAKGWAKLAAKVAAAGLPAMLLNHLLWDDDEDYEELSDYVKQNYYVVAKYGDGKFVRIPKGRALAVIQDGFEQMKNLITGDDEVDFGAFAELVVSNLAPNNPLENNLIAPIMQAKNNTTWYGDDLVPTRLQDLPAAEQFDETTDSLSKWLGEKLNISPYKINYVLDQYSGALGDTFLPMMTQEAERGNEKWWGDLIAPISDKFTTDSVLKNQNVSDFYDKKDELAVSANASGATDEDVLKYKYMNSVNADLAKLYAAKREIQNSDMPNAEKYEAVRDIQQQIVNLTEDALASYGDITFEDGYREGGEYARMNGKLYKLNKDGEWAKLSDEQATKYEVTRAAGDASYATDGTNHYRWYVPGEDAGDDAEPGWRKVTDKELERQEEVTVGLGISPETYWNNREEYSYAYDYPENYAVAKAVGGYEAYRGYSGELYDIKADKDEYGKSITGSRKEKVLDYINNLDADYYTKIILWKSEYTSDDTYNQEIVEYLNGRDDLSFAERIAVLRKLGFDVTDDGDISW